MKKNIFFIGVSICLLVLLGVGLSYSMWNMSISQDTSNVIASSECFDISITSQENSISLQNAYPISNEKGKKLTPFTFTVTNVCETAAKYSINLESLKGSTLSSAFLDVMLNNGEIKRLNTYSSANKVNSSSIESRELETGILGNKESKDYSLRLWIDYDTTMEDLNNETKVLKSKVTVIGTPISYTGSTIFNFDYTGDEQTFVAPVSGTYKLETWGAQGGYQDIDIINIKEEVNGGLGGYSTGLIEFNKNAKIYLNIGGQGGSGNEINSENLFGGNGGYNGGGQGGLGNQGYVSSNGGGGATHIAYTSGILSDLENFKSDILIVAGGGGGNSSSCVALGGSGGGFISNKGSNDYKNSVNTNFTYANNASQNYGYAFGKGADGYNGQGGICGCEGTAGGGGGYYGGYSYEVVKEFESNADVSGAGGSGYIGNSSLTNKVMYCYNCEESNEESTKTISTTCSEETPVQNCAKKGNGYARITLVSIDE